MQRSIKGGASRRMSERFPIPRGADPEEVTAAVLFLASSVASFITGAEFNVDGGWNAGMIPDEVHELQ